jgi:hypothetical protein
VRARTPRTRSQSKNEGSLCFLPTGDEEPAGQAPPLSQQPRRALFLLLIGARPRTRRCYLRRVPTPARHRARAAPARQFPTPALRSRRRRVRGGRGLGGGRRWGAWYWGDGGRTGLQGGVLVPADHRRGYRRSHQHPAVRFACSPRYSIFFSLRTVRFDITSSLDISCVGDPLDCHDLVYALFTWIILELFLSLF